MVATLTHQLSPVQFQHWTGKYTVKCLDQELDSLAFADVSADLLLQCTFPPCPHSQAATCPPSCRSFLLQLQPALPQGLTGTCPCHESYQSGVARWPSCPSLCPVSQPGPSQLQTFQGSPLPACLDQPRLPLSPWRPDRVIPLWCRRFGTLLQGC